MTRAASARPLWLTGLASGLATLTAAVILVLIVCLWVYRAPGPRALHGSRTTVILRRGGRGSEVAAALERAGVVSSAPIFMAAAEVTGAAHRLKAGEYVFASRASLQLVLQKLRNGDVVHHRITVAEGLTSRQVVEILNRSDVLAGSAPTPPEGTILPDTYDVVRGDERSAVLQRMMDADDRLLAQLWVKRRAGLPYTNAEQAITLASIVEKETALAPERPRVAGVYLNRLKLGMKLDSDPTVIYGLNGGAPLGHGLRVSELQGSTPYNTYLNPGLPPTPIDNPGRAALAASMDPTPSTDLYFVANGAGGHLFAKSLAQHTVNVARWRKLERQGRSANSSGFAPPNGERVIDPRSATPLEHR